MNLLHGGDERPPAVASTGTGASSSSSSGPPPSKIRRGPRTESVPVPVPTVVPKWLSCVRQSSDSLSSWLGCTVSNSDLGGSSGWNMSLVATGDGDDAASTPCVTLVHWVSTSAKIGRRVRLDHLNRVIYSVPFLIPSESFSRSTVLIPDVGVRMLKRTNAFRASLPHWVLQVRRMWEVALSLKQLRSATCDASDVSDLSLAVALETCCVCNSHDASEFTQHCACCLLGWHSRCCMRILSTDQTASQVATVSAELAGRLHTLPPLFQRELVESGSGDLSLVCAMCMLLLRSPHGTRTFNISSHVVLHALHTLVLSVKRWCAYARAGCFKNSSLESL